MAIRWGILGTGFIAELFVQDLLGSGHEVVAVGSRSHRSAEAFADRFGIPAAHGDYASLCADDTVDAVYVATPNPFHAAHALLALAADKHVLVEKPFTMTVDDAAEVIAEASRRGSVVMEAMWTRFLPHMVRAREIVASGAIGELRALEADLSQVFTTDAAHRLNDPALGGGALFDLGVYVVSLAVDFLGVPQRWSAVVDASPTGVDNQASIALGFDGGRQAALHIGMDHRGPMTASIVGTRGRIVIDEAWHRPSSLTILDNEGSVIERFEAEVRGRGMQYEAAAFESLIAHRPGADDAADSAIMPHAQTIAVLDIITDIRNTWLRGDRSS